MKHILTSVVLMVLLLPALALGETMDDLERRNGLYYKTNTGVMEHLEEFFGEFCRLHVISLILDATSPIRLIGLSRGT